MILYNKTLFSVDLSEKPDNSAVMLQQLFGQTCEEVNARRIYLVDAVHPRGKAQEIAGTIQRQLEGNFSSVKVKVKKTEELLPKPDPGTKVHFYIDLDHSEIYGHGNRREYQTLVEIATEEAIQNDTMGKELDAAIVEAMLLPELQIENTTGHEYFFEESPRTLRSILRKKGFIESKQPLDD